MVANCLKKARVKLKIKILSAAWVIAFVGPIFAMENNEDRFDWLLKAPKKPETPIREAPKVSEFSEFAVPAPKNTTIKLGTAEKFTKRVVKELKHTLDDTLSVVTALRSVVELNMHKKQPEETLDYSHTKYAVTTDQAHNETSKNMVWLSLKGLSREAVNEKLLALNEPVIRGPNEEVSYLENLVNLYKKLTGGE